MDKKNSSALEEELGLISSTSMVAHNYLQVFPPWNPMFCSVFLKLLNTCSTHKVIQAHVHTPQIITNK